MKEPQGKKEYYAKSNPLILNKDHLAEVGKLAERYGEEIGSKEEGGVAGRLHDFGKYSDRFQGVLLGTHHGGLSLSRETQCAYPLYAGH